MGSTDRRPRVLVLQHAARAPLGALEEPLRVTAEVEVLAVCDGAAPGREATACIAGHIELPEYDAVIALGGPMGLYETDRFPCLELSSRLVAEAVRREVPTLGLGLGSQMLAQALGAPVFRGAKRGIPREMGFMSLYLTKAGGADPVMRIFGVSDPQLFWHQDTHDVPDDADHLASTALYHTAAFRWGRWAYGLQFHLEATADLVERWVDEDRADLEDQGMDPASVVAQAWMLDDATRDKARRLAALFVDWARERAPR